MKPFTLFRHEDESGVSGTGTVAYGVEFPDGQIALWWATYGGVCVYRDRATMMKVHGHNGKTIIDP